MRDLIVRMEDARRRLRLRQADVSSALGMTQGHFSKVARGRTPLGPALAGRIEAWLSANDPGDGERARADPLDEAVALVDAIGERCAELRALIGEVRARRRG